MALQAVSGDNEFEARVQLFLFRRKRWDYQYKTSIKFCFDELGQLSMTILTPGSTIYKRHILNEDSLLIKGNYDYQFQTQNYNRSSSANIIRFRIRFKNQKQQLKFRHFIQVNTSTDSSPPSPSEWSSSDDEEEEKEEEKKKKQPDYNNQLNQIEARYRCRITNNFMKDPVRVVGEDKSQVFERSAIKSLIDRNDGIYIGPNTGKRIEADKVRLISCKKIKQEIEDYTKLIKMYEEEQMTKNKHTKSSMTLQQIDINIEELEKLGAPKLAQPLKKQQGWLNEWLTSDDYNDSLMKYAAMAVSLGLGVTTGAYVINSKGDVVTASGAALSATAIAGLALIGIKHSLGSQNKERIQASNAHHRESLNKLEKGVMDPIQLAERDKKVNKIYNETQKSLDIKQELTVEAIGDAISAQLKCIGICAAAGAVGGGMLFDIKLLPAAQLALELAEDALIDDGCSLEGAELTAAALETLGGAQAFLATHGTLATVGGVLAGAACGAAIAYGIWRLGKYNGWWGE